MNINAILGKVKDFFLAKRFGYYVGVAGLVFTLCYAISYCSIDQSIFSSLVIVFAWLGIAAFIALSLFKVTSSLAPVALMIFSFLSFLSFVGADGIIDFFSTQFFDGFSIGKFFALSPSVWFSILGLVLSFILASVSMYMPQRKKDETPELTQAGENK
ncbi:MAG: hypothetical protein LKF89_03970 [Bacilli bacterium]|jgi:hypothetical protein|nr:hypothetical protein [Bacilli bacterium]